MLVVNIIAALMGIAAAGACAVLVGLPVGVGKNGMAFSAISDCRHSKNVAGVRSSTFPNTNTTSRSPDFERCGEHGERAVFLHLPGV